MSNAIDLNAKRSGRISIRGCGRGCGSGWKSTLRPDSAWEDFHGECTERAAGREARVSAAGSGSGSVSSCAVSGSARPCALQVAVGSARSKHCTEPRSSADRAGPRIGHSSASGKGSMCAQVSGRTRASQLRVLPVAARGAARGAAPACPPRSS